MDLSDLLGHIGVRKSCKACQKPMFLVKGLGRGEGEVRWLPFDADGHRHRCENAGPPQPTKCKSCEAMVVWQDTDAGRRPFAGGVQHKCPGWRPNRGQNAATGQGSRPTGYEYIPVETNGIPF